jgi:hypothetical protein
MCAMPASLLISGFLRAHQAAGRPRLPKLERMLARATRREPRHTHDFLAGLFGLEPAAIQQGPFLRLADGGQQDDGWWLRADPVHLAPDRDQLVLMPGSVLEVQHGELQALAQAFDATYAVEGWHLEFPSRDRGYLRAPRSLDVLTHDPEPFVGGPVFDAMPTGPDSKLLKQLMNETQMLFHTHAVNAVREEAGRPAINSLWCWGGGQLPPETGRAPKRIISDLALVRGLAIWAQQDTSAPIPTVHAIDGDLIALVAGDMEALDKVWFGPLFAQLQSGDLKGLDIHLEGLGDFSIDSAAARRFWRLPKKLSP